jgi:hypothetical protein
MVFKKGHAPIKKGSSISKKQSNDISDFFVKFGIKSDMKNNLSNLSYLIATLKKDLSLINDLREKKAFLRKELYETLISLRLNVDSMERHMPSKEFEALKNKIGEISRYAKKEKIPEIIKINKAIKEPSVVKKPEIAAKKNSSLINNASDKEKKELELLKKDLEEISKQLRNRE